MFPHSRDPDPCLLDLHDVFFSLCVDKDPGLRIYSQLRGTAGEGVPPENHLASRWVVGDLLHRFRSPRRHPVPLGDGHCKPQSHSRVAVPAMVFLIGARNDDENDQNCVVVTRDDKKEVRRK